MSLYADTSALLPVYAPEALSDKATTMLAEAKQIYVSRLAEVEMYSALARKVRMRELDRPLAREIADAFARHLHAGLYATLHVSNEAFDLACDYLKQFSSNLRTLDALHLACCARARLTLLTADKTLAAATRQFDVACAWLG